MYLQDNPELFQLFLEHTPAAVAMFDSGMRYIAASRRWLTDYGLGEQSLIGRCHYEVFPEIPQRWKEVHQRCLAGTVESCEADSFVRTDGSIEWVKWDSRPWYNNKGEIGGIVFLTEVVTKRKQAEEALRQSEARFQKLAANVPGMIFQFLLRPDGSAFLPYTSGGCRKLLELEPEIIQQNVAIIEEMVHQSDRQSYYESMAVSADTLLPWLWEGRIITHSGKLKWVRAISRPEKQANGDILWNGLIIDISEQVQAEQELRQYQGQLEAKVEERTRELAETNLQLQAEIAERKQAEEIIHQSKARYQELAKREKLLNRLSEQIRHTLDLDKILETAVQEIQDLLQLDRCIFAWYKPEANPPIWQAIKEAKKPSLASILGCYPATAIGENVNNSLANQEIVRIDDVTKTTDPNHRQLLRSLGYKSEIALPIQTNCGQIGVIVCIHCTEFHCWTDAEVELLQAVLAQLAIAINQAELYAQSQQTALSAQQQAQQLQQTLQELQKTQTQLVQSEKMSSLGQLVAGIAHEINNPVNFIYGNIAYASGYTQDILDLLKLYQKAYPQPTPEILEEIDAIDLDFLVTDLPKLLSSMKVGAQRIREIVRSLRNFSRLDEAQKKAVDIHEGIESTLMILQNRLKAKPDQPNIEVIKSYGNLPPVECYPGQLNQVFMNLIVNAIDALEESLVIGHWSLIKDKEERIKERGQICISTEVLDNQRVFIRIADNGSGMTPETQQRLFDPFFTTKPVGVGTGLGLSISYQIVVEKHNGKLLCHSELGQGTEFVIEIPVNHKEL
jgi:PAS domain S-box-containing protein